MNMTKIVSCCRLLLLPPILLLYGSTTLRVALGHDAGGRVPTRPCASAGMAAGATPLQLGPRARSPAHGCALRAALEFGGPRRQQGPVRRRWDAPLPSGAGRR